MSTVMNARRARSALALGLVSGTALIAALAASAWDAQRFARPEGGGLAAPDWERLVGAVDQISIERTDLTLTLTPGLEGWSVAERAGFPVRPERLSDLDQLFTDLRLEAPKTADPGKHARLDLGDPADGGSGARVRVSAGDALVADWIIGRPRPGGGVYLRRPGADQTWAGDQNAPNFARIREWLDLDIVSIPRNTLARVDVTPSTGPGYTLVRDAPSAPNFALDAGVAGWTLFTSASADTVGGGLSRLVLQDVKPAKALSVDALAGHRGETFDGLAYEVSLFEEPESAGEDGRSRYWATLSAVALSEDQRERAAAVNARTQGWAFAIDQVGFNRLTQPLDEIAEPDGDA